MQNLYKFPAINYNVMKNLAINLNTIKPFRSFQ